MSTEQIIVPTIAKYCQKTMDDITAKDITNKNSEVVNQVDENYVKTHVELRYKNPKVLPYALFNRI